MTDKQAVKRRYAQLARSGKGCCGGARAAPCPTAAQRATSIGYRPQEVAAAPTGANLGLGCGNPLALAEIRPGDTVLDLGSGAGFDCFLASQRVGAAGRVIGVDLTAAMVARARAHARRAGVANVEFRVGDVEALPLEDQSVDLVISNCVLNLVPDKAQAFREMARVLKPGGRVMVSDILRRGDLPAAIAEHPEGHVACLSGAMEAQDYLRLMAAAGLAEARIVSETDAADLLAAAPDCAWPEDGPWAALRGLRGKIVSATVRAVKPPR